jgi:hypothetical protein
MFALWSTWIKTNPHLLGCHWLLQIANTAFQTHRAQTGPISVSFGPKILARVTKTGAKSGQTAPFHPGSLGFLWVTNGQRFSKFAGFAGEFGGTVSP